MISFGTRRAHPALSAMIERSSYIGGLNSVSNVLGAKLLKKEPSGTMPHAFILCVGDEVRAWRIFNEALPKNVPRIALVDTFSDEKTASVRAFESLGKDLYGVRLDTPSSRRGDLKKIVQEVRWELTARGGKDVKIFVSGGLDEQEVTDLNEWVDGFGIGTSISTAPVIDFGGKIVALEDEHGKDILRAKRGDLAGVKKVYRNTSKFEDVVTLSPISSKVTYKPLLRPLIREGKIVRNFLNIDEIRARTAKEVQAVSSAIPEIVWG